MRPRRRFLQLLLVLVLAAPVAVTPVACGGGPVAGEVLKIHDGDTLTIAGIGRVRLLGIDVPEQNDSPRDDFYRHRFGLAPLQLRSASTAAKRLVRETAAGKRVRLDFDGERRDRHGRTLAYVYLPDGRLLNRLLLERGLAAVYRRFDFHLKSDFLSAESEARRRGEGMWAQNGPRNGTP